MNAITATDQIRAPEPVEGQAMDCISTLVNRSQARSYHGKRRSFQPVSSLWCHVSRGAARTVLAAGLLLSARLAGEVIRLDVTERSVVLDGKAFGTAGAFERVKGRVHFALDPKLPANAIIRDL